MTPGHRGLRNVVSVVILCGTFLGFASNAALAQGQGSMGPGGASGVFYFIQYCAQCHGTNGTGDGPVAASLVKKPANLTLLAKNNGGVFPEKEVREYIDGRKSTAAHGSREMPIWGTAFQTRQAVGNIGAPAVTKEELNRRIDILIRYIKSLQAK
jgi:mono/diheme cytochrome c family protein